jgi:hypothetical protein
MRHSASRGGPARIRPRAPKLQVKGDEARRVPLGWISAGNLSTWTQGGRPSGWHPRSDTAAPRGRFARLTDRRVGVLGGSSAPSLPWLHLRGCRRTCPPVDLLCRGGFTMLAPIGKGCVLHLREVRCGELEVGAVGAVASASLDPRGRIRCVGTSCGLVANAGRGKRVSRCSCWRSPVWSWSQQGSRWGPGPRAMTSRRPL